MRKLVLVSLCVVFAVACGQSSGPAPTPTAAPAPTATAAPASTAVCAVAPFCYDKDGNNVTCPADVSQLPACQPPAASSKSSASAKRK